MYKNLKLKKEKEKKRRDAVDVRLQEWQVTFENTYRSS
jgi:hypothetical protein